MQNLAPATMAAGASPVRFLAEEKTNEGESLEEVGEENRGEEKEAGGDSSAGSGAPASGD